MVRKIRKVVNGVSITLLQKTPTVEQNIDFSSLYNEAESKLTSYVDTKFASLILPENIQDTIQQEIQTISSEIQSESLLSSSTYVLTQEDFFSIIENDPEEANIITFDDQNESMVWRQSPNARVADLENTVINYDLLFESDHIKTSKLHIPYAVKWSIPPYYEWGGNGKAGIFWVDPWGTPVDNFSLKMGLDNSDIGETGYAHEWTYGYRRDDEVRADGVVTATNYYDTSLSNSFERTGVINDLVMKFSNGSEIGRGWAWTRVGVDWGVARSDIPVMSLTNLGILTTEHSIVSNRYSSLLGEQNDTTPNYIDSLGAFHIVGYEMSASTDWSGDSIISVTNSDLTSGETGYILTYEHFDDPSYEGNDYPYSTFPGISAHSISMGHLRLRKQPQDITGFVNLTGDSIITFGEKSDREFEILPVDDTFEFYINSKLYQHAGGTIEISDTEGLHYIVFSAETGELASYTVGTTAKFIEENAAVAIVFWDLDNQQATGIGDERHGCDMASDTHHYLHDSIGSVYISGYAPFGITADASGNLDSSAEFGIEAGEFYDEDLHHNTLQTPAGETIPMHYMSGATGEWDRNLTGPRLHPVLTGGTGRAVWNEDAGGGSWDLTEVVSDRYVLTHIFGTNDINYPIIGVVGQDTYISQQAAQDGAEVEIGTLVTVGLPVVEFVPLATMIYHTNSIFTNQSKSRIVTTGDGDDYVDWRDVTSLSPGGGSSDHGSLAGLSDDDHLQYHNDDRAEDALTGNNHLSLSANTLTATTMDSEYYRENFPSKYYTPAALVTGTTILKPTAIGGLADWHTVDNNFGFQPDWTGYTWNEGELGSGYFCGMLDHTLFFDEIEKYWHIIGIRNIWDAGNAGNQHTTESRASFLHAKSKTMGGLSGDSSNGDWVEVGIIDSISGKRNETTRFDNKIVNSVWAPHLIERDGCYYLFYAGVELNVGGLNGHQRIFVAKSYDLEDWSDAQITHLFGADDASWSDYYDAGTISNCRDPFVIWDGQNNRWQMFVTMTESPGAAADQVLAIATGETLTSGWHITNTRIKGIVNQAIELPYESSNCIIDPSGNYWLGWTAYDSGNLIKYASGTTLFGDENVWTRVPSMDGPVAPTSYEWAHETLQNPYDLNVWNISYSYYYDNWSPIEFDKGITFTAGTAEWVTEYDELNRDVTVTTQVTGSTFNVNEFARGHIKETEIHMTPDELQGSFDFVTEHELTGTTHVTFTGENIYSQGFVAADGYLFCNQNDGAEGQVVFDSSSSRWIVHNNATDEFRFSHGIKTPAFVSAATLSASSIIYSGGQNLSDVTEDVLTGTVHITFTGAEIYSQTFVAADGHLFCNQNDSAEGQVVFDSSSSRFIVHNNAANEFRFSHGIKTPTFISAATISASTIIYSGGNELQNVLSSSGHTHIPSGGTILSGGAIDGQIQVWRNSIDAWSAETSAAGVTDHTLLSNIGTNTHDVIDDAIDSLVSHTGTSNIHFTEASLGLSDYTTDVEFDIHTGTSAIHFTEASLGLSDYTTDVEFDIHTGNSAIHFTEASIDHDKISNNGSNVHTVIDSAIDSLVSHTGTSDIHFTESSIDHGSIDGLGDDDHTDYHTEARADVWLTGSNHVVLSADTITATTIYTDALYSGGNEIQDVLSPSGHTHSGQCHMSISGVSGGENRVMLYTDHAITVTKTVAVYLGAAINSVAWTISRDADRSKAGTTINGGTCTSRTTGDIDTSMTSASVAANNWVMLKTSSVGAGVDEFSLTFMYTID